MSERMDVVTTNVATNTNPVGVIVTLYLQPTKHDSSHRRLRRRGGR